ncbi:MAG: CCA tRNA nucleotidyltransferase [Lawsonibacter sp.]
MTEFDPRALSVLERLKAAGYQAVFVGGCVRDSLRALPPHDYDAATSARPEEILRVCGDLHCIETGIQHGTITVLSQGLPVEVTTFRREGTYSDHRHPDQVSFTPYLEEDLARRDFTINAMAWDGCTLIDPFGGLEDLRRRQIRCVGNPDQRMEEDALRLLRGLRLAAQLEFHLCPSTAQAIRSHTPQLSLVAWERICHEWLRLLCGPGAEPILLEFPQVTVQVIPELQPAVGFDQHSPYHYYDVYTHSVKTLAGVSPSPALRLAALLHDLGKPATFSLDEQGTGHFYAHPQIGATLAGTTLERLRVDRTTREHVIALIARHHLPVEPTRPWVGRWLSRLGKSLFFDLLAIKRADAMACAPRLNGGLDFLAQVEQLAQDILAQPHCLSRSDLAINGQDALTAGLSGPEVGHALTILLDEVAQGKLENSRPVLLQQLRQLKKEKSPHLFP